MVLLMDEEQVGNIAGVTAMGNEGMQWVGMEPFVGREHFIQNIIQLAIASAVGTYFHFQTALQRNDSMTARSAREITNHAFKLLPQKTLQRTNFPKEVYWGSGPKGLFLSMVVCR